MSDIAIRVEGLSKQFQLGKREQYRTLRDTLTDAVKAPFRRFGSRRPLEPSEDDTLWALKDVSFEVKHGEVLGVIGRNGAGKSTLLKILSRITEPTHGRVEIHGRVGSLLEVGTGFHPELSGRENIFLNGAILGMKKAEIARKFDEIVAFAEVERFVDTPVKHYSSGMYVRLAFAVAAHMEPEVLIIDEVLAVGDAGFQQKCLGKIGEVATKGRTVLFVSHNMQAISNLCSRAVLLDRGSVLEHGQTVGVIGQYFKQINSAISSSRDQIWPDSTTAPGNDRIRLHRVRLLADLNDTQKEIHLDTSISVEVEYWNLVPETKALLNLQLYSIDGTEVLEDWSAEETNWRGIGLPYGLFKTVCNIPDKLLNEGTYRIRILFFEADDVRILYDYRDAVGFSVSDVCERPVRWHGRFIGPVHPPLAWTTRLITSNPNELDVNNLI